MKLERVLARKRAATLEYVVKQVLIQLPRLLLVHPAEAAAGNDANTDMKELVALDFEVLDDVTDA